MDFTTMSNVLNISSIVVVQKSLTSWIYGLISPYVKYPGYTQRSLVCLGKTSKVCGSVTRRNDADVVWDLSQEKGFILDCFLFCQSQMWP